MTKEFLSYELAVKLKQLGFKERCLTYYENGIAMINSVLTVDGWDYNTSFLTYVSRPTFSQAFRWFREEHGVSVYISPLEDGSAFYHMVYTNINVPYSNRICSLPSKWNTYEEAELDCLDKLIEIVEGRES